MSEVVHGLLNDYDVKSLEMPGDDSPSKNVVEKKPRVYKESKKALHRKMRSLGMGKHVAGNALSLANHKRVPGEVTVGQGKTVAQVRAEQKASKKRKNKMARKSRRKNRR